MLTSKVYARVKKLCKTSLNGSNLMRGINEHAISLLNYYIGLIDVEPDEFAKIDQIIRQILIHHGIHL